MSEAQHLVLTGAAGFIGAQLARRLLDAGHHVLGIDDFSTGSKSNLVRAGVSESVENPLSRAEPTFRLIEDDVASAVRSGIPGPPVDAVFHLAASVGVGKVVSSPSASAENNLDQTRAALRFAKEHRARFVYTSSSEVYGKCPTLPCKEDAELVFGPPTASRWSYGLAKALDEHLVIDAANQSSLTCVVARIFNTIGQGQTGKHGMVLPKFVEAAACGGELVVHDDGLQMRCFCDVRDTAEALSRLGLSESPLEFHVFNVGGEVPTTILDLAKLVQARAHQMKLPGGTIVHRDSCEIYGPNFEDPKQRRPCLDRVKTAINWSPRIQLQETVDQLLRDAVASPHRTSVGASR